MESRRRKQHSGSRAEVQDLRFKLKKRRRTQDRSPSQTGMVDLDLQKSLYQHSGRSRSPISHNSRSPVQCSSADDRKSYQKFLAERETFLKKQQSQEIIMDHTRSRSRGTDDRSHKKKKHKHKKDKKKERKEKQRSRSKEREQKHRKSNGNILKTNEVTNDKAKDDDNQSYKKSTLKSNESLPKMKIESKRAENIENKIQNGEKLEETEKPRNDENPESSLNQEMKDTQIPHSNLDLDDNFDDFDENDLSSISGSTLSLSSEDDDDHAKVSAPIDGWMTRPLPMATFNRRPSNTTSISPTDRERSRSCSQTYERRHARSISPMPQRTQNSWETQVSEFIQSVGGDHIQMPNLRNLEPVVTTLAPVYIAPISQPSYGPPVATYPVHYGLGHLPGSLNFNGHTSFVQPFVTQMSTVPPEVPANFLPWSTSIPTNGSASISDEHAKELEEEPPHEEIVSTPLIKFVGQKLADKKITNLRSLKEGFFQFNLLSVVSRGEWIAAKVISAFDKSGFTESKLYNMAAMKGEQGLSKFLKDAVDSKKVNFGSHVLSNQDSKLINCVIRLIVKYCTYDGITGDAEEDDINLGDDISDKPITDEPVQSRGLANLVKNLNSEAAETSQVLNEPEQSPVNPWSNMWNWMQSESFKTFLDLKNNLAKGFMGIGTSKFSQKPFDTAQDLVSCWVIAGFNLNALKQMFIAAEDGRILPPKNYSSEMGKYLFHELLEKLKLHRSNFPTYLVDEDLELLIRKTLIYVARGCDRMSALSSNPLLSKFSHHHHKNKGNLPSSINYVYNYLPPGLRESENGLKSTLVESAKQDQVDEEDGTSYISSDPLSRIIDPVAGSHRPGELPYRKYLIGAVHVDWVVINGKPEIFELSIYVTDMTSLEMYIITDVLQKHQDVLEHLNFVANPDRHEFYFVQVGIGCVRAEWKEKAMDKLSKFLDEKRHSASENQNNGLVLLFRGEEELSVLLSAWQETGHNDLLLDTVKGFGCLDNYMEKHKSANLEFVAPKLNVGGNEAFFTADVKRGLKVSKLISKSKGQALYQAYEIFLEQTPNYQNFIQPFCFTSFSSQVTNLKQRLKQIEEMYPVEVFIAASLKCNSNVMQSIFLEGVFAPSRHRDLRDKCQIVSSRFITAIIAAGFDKCMLKKCFKRDPGFSINSSVILDKMTLAQRMSVTDQTMRCIHLLKEYFQEHIASN